MHPLRLRSVLSVATICGLLSLRTAGIAAEGDSLRTLVAQLKPSTSWAASEPARVAIGDNLFDLIDGGAELYHEFGFKQAISWQLETPARASIQVELYEMTDAAAAYGEFSLMQSGKFTHGTVGQGSLRFGYYTAFWSGHYFASVTGAQADAPTQAEVDRLAGQLAALLPHDGALPGWFAHLPAQGLQERKYFRGKIGLANIPVGEVSELFDSREGLVATYPGCRLLLLHFPTAAEADAGLALSAKTAAGRPTLTALTTDAAGFSGTDGDGNRIVVRTRGGDLLAFVFTDEAAYRTLAGQLDQPTRSFPRGP